MSGLNRRILLSMKDVPFAEKSKQAQSSVVKTDGTNACCIDSPSFSFKMLGIWGYIFWEGENSVGPQMFLVMHKHISNYFKKLMFELIREKDLLVLTFLLFIS